MINIASKAGNYLRATNNVVANGLRPLAGAAIAEKKSPVVEKREYLTVESISKQLPLLATYVQSGVTSKCASENEMQRKHHHFDRFQLDPKNYITKSDLDSKTTSIS
jgi:hypothetical protein